MILPAKPAYSPASVPVSTGSILNISILADIETLSISPSTFRGNLKISELLFRFLKFSSVAVKKTVISLMD